MSRVLLSDLEERFGYPGTDVNYLCNIGRKRAFLYYETPKVACSTIKRTLQLLETDGPDDVPSDVHDKPHSPLKGPCSTELSYEDIFLLPGFFRFTFVRNPYTRVLSCYLEKIVADWSERSRLAPSLNFDPNAPISFEDFLRAIERLDDRERDVHYRSQSVLINDRDVRYDFIGRFEQFDLHFPLVLDRIGPGGPDKVIRSIRHHRVDAHLRLHEFYDEIPQALVKRIYRNDFLRYGYSFALPR